MKNAIIFFYGKNSLLTRTTLKYILRIQSQISRVPFLNKMIEIVAEEQALHILLAFISIKIELNRGSFYSWRLKG